MTNFDIHIPNDDTVSPADIQPGADLRGADLSNADLDHANLSGAYLTGANLSEADLPYADLSEAYLDGANLSGANLLHADLSDANVFNSDLSRVNIGSGDLSGADIRRTDLRGANLAETTLAGAVLSRETDISPPDERIKREFEDANRISEQEWQDVIARANRELRTCYSENGLLGRARKARVRERLARRREAKAENTWRGNVAWAGNLLSGVFTGYGVQLMPVVGWMGLLYLLSAGIYWYSGGMALDRSLYYSVVTFTTAPPKAPPSGLSSVVAGFQTLAGTVAIVFLGYVLGSREQV
ncbi:pentapeptide repeat-containing protein [Halorubrum laminariae]|uniref:Pentapeptide repeat-containing protein n=1 Tax=Halorubrum laminariae TaxID=1433523 RepID=A0ABD6C588_9EURY|nr:pentapeptide repeat-containing protein [Halorubrum laminariae]